MCAATPPQPLNLPPPHSGGIDYRGRSFRNYIQYIIDFTILISLHYYLSIVQFPKKTLHCYFERFEAITQRFGVSKSRYCFESNTKSCVQNINATFFMLWINIVQLYIVHIIYFEQSILFNIPYNYFINIFKYIIIYIFLYNIST